LNAISCEAKILSAQQTQELSHLRIERSAIAHIGVSSIGTLLLVWYGLTRPLTGLRELGLALAIAAFLLWATARVQLGTSFSVKPQAKALVTRGVYSRICNPIYTFGLLWIVGLVLAVGHPAWLLILLALLPMQIVRARREARVLEAKFGEEYRAYRARTWF
jgi:protein-S-isoprenylcysteine O-methyltransferase Ste14